MVRPFCGVGKKRQHFDSACRVPYVQDITDEHNSARSTPPCGPCPASPTRSHPDLEPHLSQTHSLGGFSGPDLFTEAWQAFTDLLTAEDIPYQ